MLTLVVILLLIGITAAVSCGEPAPIQQVSQTINQQGEVGDMSKGLSLIIIALIPLALCAMVFIWIYNDIVNKEEEVLTAWSDIESQHQRRANLAPNLVEAVTGYATQEENVLSEVTKNRQLAMAAMQGMQHRLDDETALSEAAQTQQALGASIARLFAVVENYPQLRSADHFLALQDQIEGTENRINVARLAFNDRVQDYNSAIRKMPGALVAGMGGFKRKAYFQAEAGAEQPVQVKF